MDILLQEKISNVCMRFWIIDHKIYFSAFILPKSMYLTIPESFEIVFWGWGGVGGTFYICRTFPYGVLEQVLIFSEDSIYIPIINSFGYEFFWRIVPMGIYHRLRTNWYSIALKRVFLIVQRLIYRFTIRGVKGN